MPFNIIVINPNNFTISDFIPSKIKYDDILDFVKDNTYVIPINEPQEMMAIIINTLGLTPEIVGHTANIIESTNYIIQMCHLLDDESTTVEKPINEIANIFTKGLTQPERKDIIKGPVVCMKTSIDANDTYQIDSVTVNDLAMLLYRNCVKRGIVLNKNSSIDEFEYVAEPVEFMTLDEKLNTKFFEFQASEYIIKVFIEINPSFCVVNEPLSAIFGRHNVLGRGFITQQNVDGRFIDLDKSTFEKLLYVLSDRQRKENEEKPSNVDNFYRLLDKKYKKFKKNNPNKQFVVEDNGQNTRPPLNELVRLQLKEQENKQIKEQNKIEEQNNE